MVRLDTEAGGLLRLALDVPTMPTDEADYLAALHRIGAQPGPFVLLARFAGQAMLSQAGERAQALWFKATRAHMNETCRALAMVRPGKAGSRSAEVFGKLWTFPVAVFEEEDAARAFLRPFMEPPG
ncbi:hypothetical protein [Falsiroseomonas tokyonensis]|uniref:STAS/SEC14 domain-containing protein n=1 Tax=Falsiroseomonas tokyonensis TaxID=430521 RepID=A0ABV7BX61_9PROT|nr:hypothetical protein [Falsiroseomonas tokyonensis]MBU8539844.1 hypothetical protein [Falsiroseomonas tokyonensis]